jgi:hypothetical protein
VTKNERAAIKADGFVNYYHSPVTVRANREGLRGDLATRNYFGHLAPTVVWMPDYLVTAWAELYEDEVDFWNDLINNWRGRCINDAGALVQVFLAIVNGLARDTHEACHG